MIAAAQITVAERQREHQKARTFWEGLSVPDRWALGDALVLGEGVGAFLEGKPSSAFLAELDLLRTLWEIGLDE